MALLLGILRKSPCFPFTVAFMLSTVCPMGILIIFGKAMLILSTVAVNKDTPSLLSSPYRTLPLLKFENIINVIYRFV